MAKHKVGTRKEWLTARVALLQAEKDLTHKSDELARKRQELPWVEVDKEYAFETKEGKASLKDLFRGRSQLLIYHFMFGPDYTAGCPACSAIADGFEGCVVHLANHDVTLGAVSRAPFPKIREYQRRMGGRSPGHRPSGATSTTTSASGSPRSSSARGTSNTTTSARRARRSQAGKPPSGRKGARGPRPRSRG